MVSKHLLLLWKISLCNQLSHESFFAGILHMITLLHSERPKLYTILAFLSAIGLSCSDSTVVEWLEWLGYGADSCGLEFWLGLTTFYES